MPFDFGQVILAAMENEQRMKEAQSQRDQEQRRFEAQLALQKQGQVNEESYRQKSLALEQGKFDYTKQQEAQNNPLLQGKSIADYASGAGFPDFAKEAVSGFGNMKPDTIAATHNNPLNLKYAGQAGAEQGAPASDGGFYAKFKDIPTALGAYYNQFKASSYRDLNLDVALQKWSRAGYNAHSLGLDDLKNTKVSDLTDSQLTGVINKMASVGEGSMAKGQPLIPSGNVGTSDMFPNGITAQNLERVLGIRQKVADSMLDNYTKMQGHSLNDIILGEKAQQLLDLREGKKNGAELSKKLDTIGMDILPPQTEEPGGINTLLGSAASIMMGGSPKAFGTSTTPSATDIIGGFLSGGNFKSTTGENAKTWRDYVNKVYSAAETVLDYKGKPFDDSTVENIGMIDTALSNVIAGINGGSVSPAEYAYAIKLKANLATMARSYPAVFNQNLKTQSREDINQAYIDAKAAAAEKAKQ